MNYPPANTATAWYQDDYPGATMKPRVGVLHTTEGRTLPGYQGGATAPNYTAVPDLKNKRLKWYAHFPDTKSSRALRNTSGGVETNTLGALQVELVGTCDPATHKAWTKAGHAHVYWPEAPTWALQELAAFVAWVNKAHGVPIIGPSRVWTPYPASYGQTGERFTNLEWTRAKGWCGHQHVPENTHGDPGALQWGKVADMAKALRGQAPKPTPTPYWDRIWEAADVIARTSKVSARRAAAVTIRATAARFSTKH